MKALLIPADGKPKFVEIAGPHRPEAFQALVGGYIESVALAPDRGSLFLNEDGKRLELPPNLMATALADGHGVLRPGDLIVGDVVLVGPGDGDGGILDVPDSAIEDTIEAAVVAAMAWLDAARD